MRIRTGAALAAALAALLAMGAGTPGADSLRQAGIYADPDNWTGFGRTPGSQHFSPLTGINTGNVGKLGLAWSYDLQPGASVSAPVEADGVLYTATGYSIVTALDAVTGRELWRYDPHAPEVAGHKLRYGWGIRGLAYDNGHIFVGTHDGRLLSLDAKTGKLAWSVMTLKSDDIRFITGPPRVFNGKVLIGHGGGDHGDNRGYVTCYDAATGRQLWRFYTVPGDPSLGFEDKAQAMAAKTWTGESWKYGGGGVVWHGITYDREFDRFYIGTGNAEPASRYIGHTSGDNLFSASIVALDAKTGKYVWHYQLNPGEEWDYDADMDMQLATLKIAGKPRKVLMQAPKNGFFYVIDRTNGRLISAEKFAKVTWATRIDLKTGRPVEVDGVHFRGRGKAFETWPGPTGAHNWLPMAFNPKTGLVYIPVSERGAVFGDKGSDADPDLQGGDKSRLVAWDPVRQKEVWRVETPGIWSGGAIATGGDLVFQGQVDHRFNAYSAQTGRRLWSFDARAPVIAPPITFQVNGVQYVSVLTGYGITLGLFSRTTQAYVPDYRNMARRVLTFAVGGAQTLPASPTIDKTPQPDPEFVADAARAAKGKAAFDGYCRLCHGINAIAGGTAPDLRWSPIMASQDAFKSVVHEGAFVTKGMPQFEDLSPATIEDLRFYLRTRAQQLPK